MSSRRPSLLRTVRCLLRDLIALVRLGLTSRTPFCERLIGTIRRECLDWLIPFHERHLRGILHAWVMHHNRRRPHASLGPGMPEPSPTQIQPAPSRHRLPTGSRVIATPVLNGLHHEYHLIRKAA